MAYSTNQEKLAEVRSAISAALRAQKFTHGNDSAEMANLSDLREMEKELETKISTRRRGPRAVGVRICHK